MNDLDQFLTDNDIIIADAAARLKSVTEQYSLGQLSQQEYEELVQSITDLNQIDLLTTDLARKTRIAEAFKQLMSIVGVLGKLV